MIRRKPATRRKTHKVQIRLTPAVFKKFQKEAREEDTTMSEVCRRYVRLGMKK